MGWDGPLSACSSDDDVSASAYRAGSGLIGAVGERFLPLSSSACQTEHDEALSEESSDSAGHLQSIALDTEMQTSSSQALHGVALRDGRLAALEVTNGVLEIAGLMKAPRDRSWRSVAFRAGRIWALDNTSSLFYMEASTGIWKGPWQLSRQLQWQSMCVLPNQSFLLLGHRTQLDVEFWHFPGIREEVRPIRLETNVEV